MGGRVRHTAFAVGFSLLLILSLRGRAATQTATLSPTFPQRAVNSGAQCLHEATESADQTARRRQARAAARVVNTAEARQRAATGTFVDAAALLALPDVARLESAQHDHMPQGWKFALTASRDGYLFSIKDTTDACQFAYFSDETGVIYTGQPIR